MLEQEVRSVVAPPYHFQALKDLLLISWCLTLQGTFRGLVKSMPRQHTEDQQHIGQVVIMF